METPPKTHRIRLNKLLARHGFASRRKADDLITQGRVTIDGIVCRELGMQIDLATQVVCVDGNQLKQDPQRVYIVLNKPVGVVTTRDDPRGRRTVMDLLPSPIVDSGVFPVGRLDMDSEGLLLLTNDGDWGQILLHPKHQVWKKYLVQTTTPLSHEQKKKLENGIILDQQKTLPAKVLLDSSAPSMKNQFTIEIREGRNRQIRRMCKKIGLHVQTLRRIAIGPFQLDDLPVGKWRYLSDVEIRNMALLNQN